MNTTTRFHVLIALILSVVLRISANPFPLVNGNHTFLYHTEFTDDTSTLQGEGWDFSAGQFLSHNHSPSFRIPAASVHDDVTGLLSSGGVNNASARLRLTDAIGGNVLAGSPSGDMAVYIRLMLDTTRNTTAPFVFGLQNAAAADGVTTGLNDATNPARVLSGYVRLSASPPPLWSYGAQNDHNLPSGAPFPGGEVSATGLINASGTYWDYMLHVQGDTRVALYRKDPILSDWNLVGSEVTGQSFSSDYVFLYMPGNADWTLSEFAVSVIPEPGTLVMAALCLAACGVGFWRRPARGGRG